MRSLKLSLLFLALSFGAITHAQTADEVINKHIDAIGGKEKIKGINSIATEGVISVMGNEAPVTITILNGKGFKSEVDFNGQKIVQALTDKEGWSINPMAGSSDAQKIPDEQYQASKDQLFVGGPLFDYASKGYKVNLAGRDTVGNVNAYKLTVSGGDNNTATYYIDPNTYYIVKMVRNINMNGQEGEIATTFSDYKKTDYGYVIPYSTEITMPQGFTLSSTVKKVDINKEVDPKIFEMPK